VASSWKRLVRRSPIYPVIQEWHNARVLRRWATDDQLRFEFYKDLVGPGALVFDIGANLGNRTKIFLRLGARVVAFEPQSSCAKVLKRVLGKDRKFRLVQEALGEKAGVADMHISTARVLSTLSDDWIESVSRTGRFGDEQWTAREPVQISTFDEAIKLYGVPQFAKIDVEGYERQVIAGLSHPIGGGSLEFAAEALHDTIWCLEKLQSISPYRFQFSTAESMHWTWAAWENIADAKSALTSLARADPQAWGDVYFRSETHIAAQPCNVNARGV
jgi:FkbM family methyltransferase